MAIASKIEKMFILKRGSFSETFSPYSGVKFYSSIIIFVAPSSLVQGKVCYAYVGFSRVE